MTLGRKLVCPVTLYFLSLVSCLSFSPMSRNDAFVGKKKCLYSIHWCFKTVVWRVGSKTPGEATWSFAVASLQHFQSRNLSRHPESWFRLWLFPFMLPTFPSALILRLTCQHSWRAGGERDRGALPPKDEWWGAVANREGKCEWGNYVLLKEM